MAKQLYSFVSGRVGNVVMYNRLDTPVVRSRPLRVRKTPNMQACSNNFGKAVTMGKLLRQSFYMMLQDMHSPDLHSRFSGAINRWLGPQPLENIPSQNGIPALDGFNFNKETAFTERFKKTIDIQLSSAGQVELNIPAFDPATDISFPVHTVSVELNIIITACSLSNPTVFATQPYQKQFGVVAPQPAETILFDIPAGEHVLVLTAASLRYNLANGKMEKREAFMPVSVVKGIYRG